MKQSDFDKWLTTEPTHVGVWAVIDQIISNKGMEVIVMHPKEDVEWCSCYGWDEFLKCFTETKDCEVHG